MCPFAAVILEPNKSDYAKSTVMQKHILLVLPKPERRWDNNTCLRWYTNVCCTGSCRACKTWRYKVYLTFIMSACQMIGPGSIMYVCLSVDAVQVLLPGVWAQGSQKLFYSVKGSYGPVQIFQWQRNLCDCHWHLPSTSVLQRAKVKA